MKPGTKPQLTEELTAKVRTLYLDGESYTSIQQILDINPSTWDSWVYKNYKDFRVQLQNYKHERLVRKAEAQLDTLLDSEDERIQTSNLQFTLKTLGKDQGYSDRTEVTGKDGSAVQFVLNKDLINDIPSNTEESSS